MRFLLLAVIALSGCAASRPTPTRSAQRVDDPTWGLRGETTRVVLDEIHGRATQVRALRRELAGSLPTRRSAAAHPALPCSDLCKITAAICEQAEGICFAAHFVEHAWAEDKCRDARASCRAATRDCCGCGDLASRPWPLVL